MANKTVVVTGSTKGIGKGYAREFLNRGLNVVVSGRGQDAVDQTLLDLDGESADDAKATGRTCNVADVNQVQALWDFAKQNFGNVDIWINNAGFARTHVTLLQLTPEEIRIMANKILLKGVPLKPSWGLNLLIPPETLGIIVNFSDKAYFISKM